jgi:hypothetical protein
MFFPHFYLPKDPKTGKTTLYKDEREVWDALAKINSMGQNIDQQICKIVKRIVDGILTHANDSDYHPLDYPIVRYFLHPSGVLNLPLTQRPEFIKDQFVSQLGKEFLDGFFREINACPADHLYIGLESLRAVWECATYLKANNATVCEFHPKDNARDVAFCWNGISWLAEVKDLNHEDINLYCVAQMLAGMMWLEKEGQKLREWNRITLKGQNMKDDFRTAVITFLRNRASDLLSIVEKNSRPCIQKDMNGFVVSIYARPRPQIIIRENSSQNSKRYLKLCLGEHSGQSLDYTISPRLAYSWPASLTNAFNKKLDTRLTEIETQKKDCPYYLGFLHVDLAYKYSNSQKCPDEEQAWEQAIRAKLNLKSFPVVLHTWILNQDDGKLKISDLIVINEAAELAGFTNKPQ